MYGGVPFPSEQKQFSKRFEEYMLLEGSPKKTLKQKHLRDNEIEKMMLAPFWLFSRWFECTQCLHLCWVVRGQIWKLGIRSPSCCSSPQRSNSRPRWPRKDCSLQTFKVVALGSARNDQAFKIFKS
eukprot:TRINITY_DN95585_c0_g1_i1.p4 TRINITY_DN95585_c0_g1~~TRINITY_DN95585_c0_g1_i1.p4  ORF type:complete len:144 (-),score=11.30 TRINITY_DN95585_c0_g1_i1:435-812(-)